MNESVSDENFLDCPFASVQKVVRGKWSMVILYFLSQRVLRFGELNRKAYPPVSPKVEYSLTPLGEKFLPVLNALENLAVDYQDYQA
ncbi:winged helix-turn-helix transcriptional regulator [Lactiplantibacillus plantarum]|uniref:winged helix-turn-helix transcriptional regulator n=1 Tax=Lactiplantibacillus plantarum TaxID=1590 RepID=UPI0008271B87|nr:helix-turn-helix domain-containing protein [Lactiplantibacillus plantarum]QXI70810.1 helix-turn-helix transcriptional regulator [Lactiplantibacillus plantarum]RXE77452.1 transcriptional regulator [Lactiplantibacillus plantarum]